MPSLELMIPLVMGLIIIFVIIALALRMMLRGHVDLATKRVQKLNEDNIRRELELKRKLDEAEKGYRKKIAEASKDADRIKEDGQRLAQDMREKTLAEANRERTEILIDAKDEAERFKRAMAQSVEEKILNRSGEIVKSLLTDQLTKEMHAHFVNQVLEELKQSKRRFEVETDTAEIISAQPLNDDQKKLMANLLTDKTGKKIKLRETVNTDHNIAGVYIKLGDLIIDGTLQQRLGHILLKAKKTLRT